MTCHLAEVCCQVLPGKVTLPHLPHCPLCQEVTVQPTVRVGTDPQLREGGASAVTWIPLKGELSSTHLFSH